MSSYCHKFVNYIDIEPKTITVVDSGTFQAIGQGEMHIEVLNGKTTSHILLHDVSYTPKIGLILVSMSHISATGFTTIFCQDSSKRFGPWKSQLGYIKVQGGLYHVKHSRFHETAARSSTGMVTIRV